MIPASKEPAISIRTAHDIRRLRGCSNCGEIGDLKHMPLVNGKAMHGFCALETIGIDGVVALPKAELGKITMGEIGSVAMKEICDRVAR